VDAGYPANPPRPHPALIEVAAGRGLPTITDPMPMVRSAFEHGMAGLLLTEVELTDQAWRRPVLGLLRARQASVVAWHQRLWSGLESIVAVLDEIGVEVAVAKGIAAEARWYSRLGDRPCSDLDLLISPADTGRIDDIIAAVEPSHPLCGRTRRLAERGFLHSIDLEHEGVPIDLHWDILKLGVASRNRAVIWERTVEFALPNDGMTRALDPESSYVLFLVHLNKNRFRRLLGFVDVARVYDQGQLDGDAVDRLIRIDGLETSAHASWNTVVDTLGLAARPRRVKPEIRAAVWHVAWRPSIRLRGAESMRRFRHREHLIAVLIPGRAVEAVQWWLRRRFPPAELLTYMYSPYGRRWGAEPVSTGPQSRTWAVTVGRAKAWYVRRRGVAKAAQRRRLKPRKPRPFTRTLAETQ
jgi:hypothetical protein